MEFRRGGPLDDRRRRVLNSESASAGSDEEGGEEAAPQTPAPARGSLRAYSPAVLGEHQKRLSDLIPTRPYSISLLVLFGLTAIATIITLYTTWQARWEGLYASRLTLLDPHAFGSIASWFSSILLAGASLGALVIYSIRSHRVDDYRGKYRIWLWTAAALIWASLDSATGVHSAIGLLAARLIGMPQWQDTAWMGMYALIFGVLAIRLIVEQWYSVGSYATLGASIVLYSAVAVQKLGFFQTENQLANSSLLATLAMLAHLTLFIAIAVYARHVRLDAEGKLPQRVNQQGPKKRKSRAKLAVVSEDEEEAKPKATKRRSKASAEEENEDEEASEKTQAVASAKPKAAPAPAPAPQANKPKPPTPAPAPVPQNDSEDDYDDEEGEDGQRLSKSERRRLKKMERRDQQRRAA